MNPIFLNGDAGCGKSFLVNFIYQVLTKTLSYGNSSVDKTEVLLIYIYALNILVGHLGETLPLLNDKMKSSLRNRLSNLKVIIIDEISMASNYLLYYVHMRLNAIFGCITNEPFAGITVIAVGDFFLLPTVGGRPV